MGKEDGKEESGFGFKDKAKAEETLRLLQSHEPNYRRLTVRGLLGRAKRVLSLTKAEDKIKNIKEAMAVFENWLEELDKDKQSKDKKKTEEKAKKKTRSSSSSSEDDAEMADEKDEKKEKEEKEKPAPDGVPGLGFKDKEAAERTLQVLQGRDPDYQRLAVKGLVGRAKRVLTCTKDDTKLSNIKEALAIFDNFLDEFDRLHLSRQNNPYLPLSVVEAAAAGAGAGAGAGTGAVAFLAAYRAVGGEYKRLRTVRAPGGEDKTWDIVRNEALKELKQKHKEAKLFDESGNPSERHLELIAWAYSPEEARVKKHQFPAAEAGAVDEGELNPHSRGASEGEGKRKSSEGDRKRKSSTGSEKKYDDAPSKKRKD